MDGPPRSEESHPAWITVALEEYRSLRHESLQAIDRQHQILALGTATSGVLLGLGAKQPAGSTVSVTLLVILLPQLVYLVMTLWLGEFTRMVRAGAHIAELESRIAERYEPGPPPLTWETALRIGRPTRPRIAGLYRAIFTIFLSLAATAGGLGLFGLASKHRWAAFGPLVAFAVTVLVAAIRLYIETELRMRALGGEDVHGGRFWKLARLLRCAVSDVPTRPPGQSHHQS